MIRLLTILKVLSFAERVRRQEVPEPAPFPEELTTRYENLTVEIWTVDSFENSTDIWNVTDFNSTEFWNSTDFYELTTIESESNSTEYPSLNSTDFFEWTTESDNSTSLPESDSTANPQNFTDFFTETTDNNGTLTTENTFYSAPISTISPDFTEETGTTAEMTEYSRETTDYYGTATTDNILNSSSMSTFSPETTDRTLTAEFSTIMENSTADEWLSQSTDLFSTESSIDFTFPDTSSSIMTTEFEQSTVNYTEKSISTSDLPTELFSSTIFGNFTTHTAMMTSAAEPITESIVYQSTDILSSFTPITENDYTAETTYPELNSTENFPNLSTIDSTTDMATDIAVTENITSLMTTRNEVSMTSFEATTENSNTNTILTISENATEFVTGTTENLISEESTFTSFTSNKVDSTSKGDFSTGLVTTENPNLSTSSESLKTNPTVSSIIVSTIGDTTAASETTTLTMLSSKAELTTETISITSALSFSSADTSSSALTTEISATTSGAITSVASTSSVVSTMFDFSTTDYVTSQASSSTLSSLETTYSPTTNAEITTIVMTTTKRTEMTTEETTAAGSTATEAATEGTSTKPSATTKATLVETTTQASATTTTATTSGETTTASKTTEEQTTTTTTTVTTLPEEMDFTVDDKINLASNIWKDEYSDLGNVGAKALSSDVIDDLKLILGTNGDLTKIEISVESLEEITARVGGTAVNFSHNQKYKAIFRHSLELIKVTSTIKKTSQAIISWLKTTVSSNFSISNLSSTSYDDYYHRCLYRSLYSYRCYRHF
ncbi:unnamed protein product, partial [Oikopleura dioica]